MHARVKNLNKAAPDAVKCLLVDDLEENLLALSALLEGDDVQLLTARSGAEALELLLVHDVALALLDVHMPELDGFGLAELMRGAERTRHVPIIFVTAGARDQHRVFKGYESGAVDFMFKPIEAHILKSKAGVFFQLYRQKQQLARDLTERTETLRLNEMFTALLAHDLRNPLSAIVTSAQLLRRDSNEDAVHETAARMLSAGKRMGRMIEDMLDLARARLGGGISLKREAVDLHVLVESVVREHQVAFPERCVQITQEGRLHGEWDATRLSQVASNLLGNAFHYGRADEPIQVTLDGTRADCVVLSVANGGAISPEVLPHIFDPFRRGRQPRGPNAGLGLGLFIVQQILEAHGGTITVHQLPEARTVFRAQIPR